MCFIFCAAVSAQGNKNKPAPAPGCGTDFSAAVTVNEGFNISSDGGGSYLPGGKGKEKITSVFQMGNCSFDFTLNLQYSTRYLRVNLPDGRIFQSKFFNFDRIGNVPVTTDPAAMDAFCGVSYPQSDNYGGCGVDEGGAYVRRNVGFSLDSSNGLRYQYSPIDGVNGGNVAGTSFIKVYRPTPNTWHLVPEAPATAVLLTNGSANGNFDVPFWITVNRL